MSKGPGTESARILRPAVTRRAKLLEDLQRMMGRANSQREGALARSMPMGKFPRGSERKCGPSDMTAWSLLKRQ